MKLKLDDAGHAVLQDGKPVYVHDDGKEVAVDVAGTVATISRLNAEAKAHRERAEAAESKLSRFEGISDPDAARKALATVSNLDAKKLVDAGEVERVKAEAVKAVEERYRPVMEKSSQLESQLHQYMVGDAFARSQFIGSKFAAEGPAGIEMAKALFGNRMRVEDGKVVAYDAQGNRIYSRANPGNLAEPDEAIELMVESSPYRDHILRASGASGSGTSSSRGTGVTKKLSEMSEQERVALYKSDPAKFDRLRRESA